jgi:hypothetical protein
MDDDLVVAWFYEWNVALAWRGFAPPPCEFAHRFAELLHGPLTLQ